MYYVERQRFIDWRPIVGGCGLALALWAGILAWLYSRFVP